MVHNSFLRITDNSNPSLSQSSLNQTFYVKLHSQTVIHFLQRSRFSLWRMHRAWYRLICLRMTQTCYTWFIAQNSGKTPSVLAGNTVVWKLYTLHLLHIHLEGPHRINLRKNTLCFGWVFYFMETLYTSSSSYPLGGTTCTSIEVMMYSPWKRLIIF